MKDPNVVSSVVSATNDLKEFVARHDVTKVSEGARLDAQDTRQLSSFLHCISPRFVEKFLADENNPSLTCYIAKIARPIGEAYAFAWARIDKLSIDVDLAVLPLDTAGNPGDIISAIYEPTFSGRTTLSADTYDTFSKCPEHFDFQQLSAICPPLYNAFEYCSGKGAQRP
jgi:hypothetical protein